MFSKRDSGQSSCDRLFVKEKHYLKWTTINVPIPLRHKWGYKPFPCYKISPSRNPWYNVSDWEIMFVWGKRCRKYNIYQFFLSAIEEKVVRYYEKRQRPSLKGCYVKRDRKVYPVGAVWYPYVQPFGYMRCHACTCLVSGCLHNHMRLWIFINYYYGSKVCF